MPDHARSDDPAVQRQLDRFAQLSPGRDILGLERIAALMEALENPHRKLPPVIHVAGTNGKGSTCAFLRAAIEAAGLTAHVYTSPHLVRFNERIRISGTLIDDAALASLLAEVLDAAEALAIGPSFFEATTAAAFLAFSRTPADAAIIEVGLGGRLDATNVIENPLVCGIAQIGIDHEAFLLDPANGPDWPPLERIAWEKAGIAKPGAPLVCLAHSAEIEARIEAAATAQGAQLYLEGRDWTLDPPLVPGMAGAFQIRNANLAAEMLRRSGLVDDRAIRTGIASAHWPARLQKLADGPLTQGREIWIDGAHNPAAALSLAQTIAARPMHLILGILANKDASGIVSALAPHALSLAFVSVPGHTSHDPAALAVQFGGATAGSVEAALCGFTTANAPVLILGSLYLAGEVLRANGQIPE